MTGQAIGARCGGCGHIVGQHPSAQQAAVSIANSKGQFAAQCSNGRPVQCRCRATREELAASTDLDEDAG